MVYAEDLKSLTERFVGSSPTPGTKTVTPRACLWAFTVFDASGTRKPGPGHPFSGMGRTCRVEKKLGATATKFVLDASHPLPALRQTKIGVYLRFCFCLCRSGTRKRTPGTRQ